MPGGALKIHKIFSNVTEMRLVILVISVKNILAEEIKRTKENVIEANSTNTVQEASTSAFEIRTVKDIVETNVNITSNNLNNQKIEERLSSHTKRGAPPFRSHISRPHRQRHHKFRSSHIDLLHRRPRSFHNPKSRRKHRRPHKKPSGLSPTKMLHQHIPKWGPHKRPGTKPILLSEIMRPDHHGPSKIKTVSPFTKDYFDEEELELMPFSPIETIDSYPPTIFSQFPGRPSMPMELHNEIHESMPSPMEEEVFIPGTVNVSPFGSEVSSVHRPSLLHSPTTSWLTDTKPSKLFLDESYLSSIGGIRLTKPQYNNYIDKDILKLLMKIKAEGLSLDTRIEQPERSRHTNATEVNSAISKLLSPFLSDSAVKHIQSYFSRSSGEKQSPDRNVTKVIYIMENEAKDNDSQDEQYKPYPVTDPLYENGTNNTTYFIMVKSPTSKKSSNSSHSHSNTYTQKNRGSSTTLRSDSVALQNYIMSLAGVKDSPSTNVAKFNSAHKNTKNR